MAQEERDPKTAKMVGVMMVVKTAAEVNAVAT